MLLGASPASADWLQTGYDAARTGELPFEGPATDDIALNVSLPGSGTSLVVVDRHAYVLTIGGLDASLPAYGIWRVGLDDASVELFVNLTEFRGRLVTDGTLLFTYLLTEEFTGVEAYALHGGALVWRHPFPDLVPIRNGIGCGHFAVSQGTVYAACYDRMIAGAGPTPGTGDESVGYLLALDAATGNERWRWVRDVTDATETGPAAALGVQSNRTTRYNFYSAVAVREPFVYMYTLDRYQPAQVPTTPLGGGQTLSEAFQYTLTALDSADGSVQWSRNDSEYRTAPLSEAERARFGAQPTANDNAVFIRLDRIEALNPSRGGAPVWSEEVGRADAVSGRGSPGFGLAGDALLAASEQTLHRFDAATGAIRWQYTLPQTTNETWGVYPILTSGGVAYAMTSLLLAHTDILYAIDLEDGTILWRHPFVSPVGDPRFVVTVPAMDDGVFVACQTDGSVVALGESGASLRVRAAPSTRYPEPGHAFRVDLSGTEAGAQGPATAFRAQLPNGTWTPWQPEPRVEVVLEEEGDQAVRFQARNDAGQTASVFLAFEVGGSEPNLLSKLFAPENQDLTFGVLGIALALGGGIFGIARVQGRKSRVLRELRAIDEAYERNHANPTRLEAALNERRSRVQGLHLDGRLDEAQLTVLEKRVDELAREGRLASLDHRFDFLPHGMVRRLRTMLEDGHVSRWDHKHFIEALESEESLSKQQKRLVRELVDTWFERDSTVSR